MPPLPDVVRVTGKIGPTASEDTYPTHDSKYGKGGHMEVGTLMDRDAIPADRRREGMLVFVSLEGKRYQLIGGTTNANWQETGVGSGGFAPVISAYPAGVGLGGQRAVMLAGDGKLYYADCSNPAHFNRVLGITQGAVIEGDFPAVRWAGTMTEPTWAWALDKFLYLSVNGFLTQVAPVAGFVLQLGYPLSATSIMVDVKEPIFIA